MGTLDEHWCNVCKRTLDKKKDKYMEFELVNIAPLLKKATRKKPTKPKGIICQQCINADPKLKKALELMIKAGNPTFKVSIICNVTTECPDFKISLISGQNCRHIAVISDKMYCKRSHVGTMILTREKAEIEREEREIVAKWFKRVLKEPQFKALLDNEYFQSMLGQAHFSPSAVVASPLEKEMKKLGDNHR